MIIQCEQCETTYRFDTARLHNPENGAREANVRCIRCGHIFNVHAGSDLGENFLSPGPVAASQQGEKQEEIHIAPAGEPTADFSFTLGKEAGTPLKPAPSVPSAALFTQPGKLPPESSTSIIQTASDNVENDNEFIFEPPQAQSHIPDFAPAAEEGSLGSPEVRTPASAVKGYKKKKTSKLLLVALLLVVICAGAYAYYFIVHGVTSVTQVINTIEKQITRVMDPHTEPSRPSIQIQTLENFYLSNNHLGSIFVINGTTTNTSAQPQGEIALTATLYSISGASLRSIKFYSGNPINKEALRTDPLDILQKHMDNKLGAELSNVSVQPGESIPFCVVFHDLPDKFAEFDVTHTAAAK